MSTASEDSLADLHATLATVLKDAMKKTDPDTGLPAASILSVARQFLKDNFITADLAAKGSPLAALKAEMPTFDSDGNVVPLRKAGGV